MLSSVSNTQNSSPIIQRAMPGDILFLEGDRCDNVYELRTGIARGVNYSTEGDRQISAFFFAGDQIGLPIADCYRFSAEAVTETTFVRHSSPRWHEALMRSCRQEGKLLPSICAEQDPIFRRGIIIGRNGSLVRISAFLISVIDRLPEADGIRIFPFPQADIAAYLATTPETICRGLRQLREMGIISMPRRDRLLLADRCRLETLASGAHI